MVSNISRRKKIKKKDKEKSCLLQRIQYPISNDHYLFLQRKKEKDRLIMFLNRRNKRKIKKNPPTSKIRVAIPNGHYNPFLQRKKEKD